MSDNLISLRFTPKYVQKAGGFLFSIYHNFVTLSSMAVSSLVS